MSSVAYCNVAYVVRIFSSRLSGYTDIKLIKEWALRQRESNIYNTIYNNFLWIIADRMVLIYKYDTFVKTSINPLVAGVLECVGYNPTEGCALYHRTKDLSKRLLFIWRRLKLKCWNVLQDPSSGVFWSLMPSIGAIFSSPWKSPCETNPGTTATSAGLEAPCPGIGKRLWALVPGSLRGRLQPSLETLMSWLSSRFW